MQGSCRGTGDQNFLDREDFPPVMQDPCGHPTRVSPADPVLLP